MAFDDKAASNEPEATHTAEENPEDHSQRHYQQQQQRRGIRRSLLNVFDAPPSEGGGGLEEDPGRRMLALMRDMFDSRTARAWLRRVVAGPFGVGVVGLGDIVEGACLPLSGRSGLHRGRKVLQ